MKLPLSYSSKKYLQLELAGAAIVIILLIIELSGRYISFHWLKESLWLFAALLICLPELTSDKPLMKYPAWMRSEHTLLLAGLYLCTYHFFICFFRAKYINLEWMLHAGAALLFGAAIILRLKSRDISLGSFDWKNLLRYPYWPMTAGALLCLLAPFFKMTRFYSLQSTYGLQFNYNAYNGWGYNNWGYNYYSVKIAIKGYYAYWGHIACILLAFVFLIHVYRSAGKQPVAWASRFFQWAIPAILAWWIFGAKGYQSIKSFGNILFLPGLALMALAVYLPEKLEAWTGKKGLIS